MACSTPTQMQAQGTEYSEVGKVCPSLAPKGTPLKHKNKRLFFFPLSHSILSLSDTVLVFLINLQCRKETMPRLLEAEGTVN